MNKSSFDKNREKKDRMILITATAIVLVAFTLVGVYIRETNQANDLDGYIVDLGDLNNDVVENGNQVTQGDTSLDGVPEGFESVDSENIEISSLKEQVEETIDDVEPWKVSMNESVSDVGDETLDEADVVIEEILPLEQNTSVEYVEPLSYETSLGLEWPVKGEILIDYSVDSTVYFQTLDQYKINDNIVISGEKGTPVVAAARGKVIEYYTDAKIGTTVVMELGNGYKAVYGQLGNVTVAVGEYVAAGSQFATIATPSKYYSLEGANLYFKLTQNESALNPLSILIED